MCFSVRRGGEFVEENSVDRKLLKSTAEVQSCAELALSSSARVKKVKDEESEMKPRSIMIKLKKVKTQEKCQSARTTLHIEVE